MGAIKVGKLSKSVGDMKRGSFILLPPADYLLTVKEFNATEKAYDPKTKKGGNINFEIVTIIENGEKLPANENIDKYIGKTFKFYINVMTPDNERYEEPANGGGVLSDIGINELKTFLNAVGVKVVKNTFKEEAVPGKSFIATIGTKQFKSKKSGEMVDGNQVNEYKPYVEDEEEEEADELEADEDIDVEEAEDDDDDLDDDDLDLDLDED